mgnify:CR=1 FL=1
MAAQTARARREMLRPQPLLDEELVLQAAAEAGINPKHVYTMWRHVLHSGTPVEEIPGLPKALYRLVEERFVLTTSRVKDVSHSRDGSTSKLMVL